jgi:hypothetical protein
VEQLASPLEEKIKQVTYGLLEFLPLFSMVLGLIPAVTADKKDHSLFLWWLFGAPLFYHRPFRSAFHRRQKRKEMPRVRRVGEAEAMKCRLCGHDFGAADCLLAPNDAKLDAKLKTHGK